MIMVLLLMKLQNKQSQFSMSNIQFDQEQDLNIQKSKSLQNIQNKISTKNYQQNNIFGSKCDVFYESQSSQEFIFNHSSNINKNICQINKSLAILSLNSQKNRINQRNSLSYAKISKQQQKNKKKKRKVNQKKQLYNEKSTQKVYFNSFEMANSTISPAISSKGTKQQLIKLQVILMHKKQGKKPLLTNYNIYIQKLLDQIPSYTPKFLTKNGLLRCQYKNPFTKQQIQSISHKPHLLKCQQIIQLFMLLYGDGKPYQKYFYCMAMCLQRSVINVFGIKDYFDSNAENLPLKVKDIISSYKSNIDQEYKIRTNNSRYSPDNVFCKFLYSFLIWIFDINVTPHLCLVNSSSLIQQHFGNLSLNKSNQKKESENIKKANKPTILQTLEKKCQQKSLKDKQTDKKLIIKESITKFQKQQKIQKKANDINKIQIEKKKGILNFKYELKDTNSLYMLL